MAKNKIWTDAHYRAVMTGEYGLRRLVNGFDAADGYDLRSIDTWSVARKRRVRAVAGDIARITAQPTRAVFARGKRLARLTTAFHGDVPSRKFKAALVPYVEPKHPPGTKAPPPPRITYTGDRITIDQNGYQRVLTLFNPVELVINPRAEIERVLNETPNAKLFYLRVGIYDSIAPKEGRASIINEIMRLMQRYDGITKFSRMSKKYGEAPGDHDSVDFLTGIISITFTGGVTIANAARQIDDGRDAYQKQLKKIRANRR